MLVVSKCYCEFKNGGGEKNGILCERRGIFEKALLCGSNHFCTGPSSEQDATNGFDTLCEQGEIIIC